MFGFFSKSKVSDVQQAHKKAEALQNLAKAGEKRRKELMEIKEVHDSIRKTLHTLKAFGLDPKSLRKTEEELAIDTQLLDKELEDFFNGK